jgi:16S rRNA (cytosine1402-N4)-methyltransferase
VEREAIPSPPHTTVLLHEIISGLQLSANKKYIDGTLGAGGHTLGIFEKTSGKCKIMAFEIDPVAISIAKERLATFEKNLTIVEDSYVSIKKSLETQGWGKVDGIVFDFGASSMQFDDPEKGFSFRKDGPLDMRFNPTKPFTAADIINHWSEKEIADTIYQYGEDKNSRKIAKAIVSERPIFTTQQLTKIVLSVVPLHHKSRIHPATLTFQALRIAVNQELSSIESVLPDAIHSLNSGGRIAAISFHSLEDRIVKNVFRNFSKDQYESDHPMAGISQKALVKLITKKPITPTEAEVKGNPRARSAKLRIVEKL